MLPDERTLYTAILANPDDDTVRLAYADWLDENGHPERAEFVRVQIELSRLVLPVTGEDTRYNVLSARERELIGEHSRTWEKVFSADLPSNRQTWFAFRRGLVGFVMCTPKYFKECGQHLIDCAPFEVLSLRRPTARNLRECISHPSFTRFSELRFSADENLSLVLRPLVDSDLSHLRRLSLTTHVNYGYMDPPQGWANRSEEVIEQLAMVQSLALLDSLDLRSAGVGERGRSHFANPSHSPDFESCY